MKNLYPYSLLIMMLMFLACQKKENLAFQHLDNEGDEALITSFYLNTSIPDFQTDLPNYLVTMGLEPLSIDNSKASLGRVLFYDKHLSADEKISCASCHKQANGFADNAALSRGVNGQLSRRNALSLSNVANFGAHYQYINGKKPSLLWDGRAVNVIDQAPLAFTNPHEMGMTMPAVVEKIRQLEYYPHLFQRVYGDAEPSESRILECIQEFVFAIGNTSTKLDRALEKVNGDLFGTFVDVVPILVTYYYGTVDTIGSDTITRPLLNFTDAELRGRTLFAANCTKCHSPLRPLQQEFFACIGLDAEYTDNGVGDITGKASDKGVFKAPSLRNIGLSAPYMHDGRFSTLYEVVDFYSSGIQMHPNLHPLLRDENGQPKRMNFTVQQKANLVAFLKTMTSYEASVDSRFSNPFY